MRTIDIEDHLGLVHFALRRYFGKTIHDRDYEDLFQEGCIGLMKALGTYSPDNGKWSTWAVICIRSAIRHYLRAAGQNVRKTLDTCKSLDASLGFTCEDVTLADVVPGGRAPEEEVAARLTIEAMLSSVKGGNRDRTVLKGLMCGYGQIEIAAAVGISQAQVSRIKKRAAEAAVNQNNSKIA